MSTPYESQLDSMLERATREGKATFASFWETFSTFTTQAASDFPHKDQEYLRYKAERDCFKFFWKSHFFPGQNPESRYIMQLSGMHAKALGEGWSIGAFGREWGATAVWNDPEGDVNQYLREKKLWERIWGHTGQVFPGVDPRPLRGGDGVDGLGGGTMLQYNGNGNGNGNVLDTENPTSPAAHKNGTTTTLHTKSLKPTRPQHPNGTPPNPPSENLATTSSTVKPTAQNSPLFPQPTEDDIDDLIATEGRENGGRFSKRISRDLFDTDDEHGRLSSHRRSRDLFDVDDELIASEGRENGGRFSQRRSRDLFDDVDDEGAGRRAAQRRRY